MTLTAVVLAERYRLEERVAAGGVGEVWRATDLLLSRHVAVKLLRAEHARQDETVERFRAEARHAGSLSHPNITRIYDYREDDPPHPPYLVMELIDGPSLAARLASGPLAPAHVMDIVAQVADGLAAAHAADLVHRDIKPGNLLLASNGQVKITDFGISHAAGAAPVTRTGVLVGTPAYLAPERVAGASGAPAADLYSLGIVAYECLAGQPPFRGGAVQVALAHRERPLPPLSPWLPADAAALITALTAKDPRDRPASAREAAASARRLREALLRGGIAVRVPPPRPATALPRIAAAVPGLPGAGPQLTGAAAPQPTTHLGAAPGEGSLPGTRTPRAGHPVAAAPGWPRWLTMAAVTGLLVAGMAGWLLATVFAAVPAQGRLTGPAAARPGLPAARTVRIDGAALAGRPVRVVRRRLHHAGLVVRVLWRHSGRQDPGTVVAVEPTGPVPAGSLVLLTAALRPSQPPAHAWPPHAAAPPPGPGDRSRGDRGHGHGGGDGSLPWHAPGG
jgi:eukaryotic-like serine/threonine-protein kinase